MWVPVVRRLTCFADAADFDARARPPGILFTGRDMGAPHENRADTSDIARFDGGRVDDGKRTRRAEALLPILGVLNRTVQIELDVAPNTGQKLHRLD